MSEETQWTTLWLSLDGDTQWEDVHRLIAGLTDAQQGIRAEPAGAGPGLGDIVLGVMLAVTSATTLANQLLDIAEKVRRWREHQQQEGRPARVRIERSNGDVIDLDGIPADHILPLITKLATPPAQLADRQQGRGITAPDDKD